MDGVTAMALRVGGDRVEVANVVRSTGVVGLASAKLVPGEDYTLCYASKLGFDDPNTTPQPEDYRYSIGTLTLSDGVAYDCDFEGQTLSSCGMAIYRPSQEVDFEWKLGTGQSTTPGSGPTSDHTTGTDAGHYAIMKSPGYMNDASAAVLIGPALFPADYGQCLTFAYNMNGQDVNALRVYMAPSKFMDGPAYLSEDIPHYSEHTWGTPRWVGVGNKGEGWHLAGVPIVAKSDGPFHPVFEALAGKSEKGDIAVDDVKLVKGRCPAETRSHPKSTVDGQTMICGEVRMVTGKHPDDKSWKLDGAISCSGRGYSAAEVEGAWMPCCVPHFGTYTLMLQDSMNDGWEGSKLEMRFFDRTYEFGKEIRHRTGEVQIPVVIGQLDILKAQYSDKSIEIDVRVTSQNSHVWCGVAEALEDGSVRTPSPRKQLLKDYGVRSRDATTEPGEVRVIGIKGDFIKPNRYYDVYCYAEAADTDANGIKNEMDNEQIAATRYRMASDIEAPRISVLDVNVSGSNARIKVASDEPAKVWCSAILLPNRRDVNKDMVQLEGEFVQFKRAGEQDIEFDNLAGESVYKLHCFAQDFAEPWPNHTSDADLKNGGIFHRDSEQEVKFSTSKRHPNSKITHVATIANGFDVHVNLDGAGKVYCAAAPEGVDFPSATEVIGAGASAQLTKKDFIEEGVRDVRVAIRGVKTKTPYKVFCLGTSLDGALKSGDKEMWKSAVPAVSYGRFCDIPANPPTAQKEEKTTPFDPLTSDEELTVRRFMLSRKELNLSAVYRVTLFHNKSEIYSYYDHQGEMPKRYARVRIGRCVDNRGFYEQLRVGPLDVEEMDYLPLAEPVETTCGGYNAEGIFGRRLASDDFLTAFQDLLRQSFGAPFNAAECYHGTECLRLGAVVVGTPEKNAKGRLLSPEQTDIWVGLKRPTGQPLPIYFSLSSDKLGIESEIDPSQIPRLLDTYNWEEYAGPVWYDGKTFDSVAEILKAWRQGALKLVSLDILDRRRRAVPTTHKRRLAPSPYGGAAGTAGLDLDRSAKRSGLEYRVPPEHVEPGGKRYTIKSHPGGQSYTIEYAGWSFVVTNDRDKSLQIWNIMFENERIVFQLGLQEAMAHYTVSERTFFFMDSWYGGLGGAARPVLRGYECPKHGSLVFYDQSLCVWEQDMARPIRSHYRSGEIRDAAAHYALHIRQMLTVSNYDYVTTYVFHPSGHVEAKVEFTGELYAGVEVPWYSHRQAHYGTLVTGAMRMAALHAHLVIWRIDFDLEDYQNNSVWFEHVIPDPKRLGANYIDRFFPDGEKAGAIGVNDTRNVAYEVVSENRNTYGNYGGWRILPGHSWSPNQPHAELYAGTGAWAKYKVFSTQFKYGELDATLPRDNKFAGDPAVSVDRYINDNEPLRNTDVVTWSSMSFMHIPCAEDYPLTIPIGNTLSMMLRPNNWFLEDPTMDLHNAIGGDFKDPGQCAVVRKSIFDAMDVKSAKGPIVV
ncbi:amine oxidase [Gregarina niphandrodes]|uniref:Amine oxidase n=1 Tax=Gregarina niphandrodes TaxID=110365 RepID=A0A023B9Y4_GRENI|nr:amine oxidase [Gregarina niphandrodes]EZG76509.1 amine oxidase [Gregarina niphandrodes]|eukprot:XP_011129569.1 amine oxidase [Gregarina niphandrodes]